MLLCSILGGICLLFVLILCIPTEIGADYKLEDKTQALRIRVRVLGIPFSLRVPLEKADKKAEQAAEKDEKKAERQLTPKKFIAFSKELYQAYRDTEQEWKTLIQEIKAKFACREIYFTIRYGTVNPARTGILNGAVWTAGSMILKLLDSMLTISKKTLAVYPEFNRPCMCIHMKGSFRFKLIDAARLVLKVIKLVKLIKSKIKTEF